MILQLSGDVAVARAVIAHAHAAVFLIPFIGHGKHPAFQRNGAVEGRLEHAHPRRRRQQLLKHADGLQVRPVVGRGDGEVGPHALQHFLRQEVDAIVVLGQHRLEAHRLNVVQGRDGVAQCVQKTTDAGGVIGDVQSLLTDVAGGGIVVEYGIGRPHPLHLAVRKHIQLRHLPQLEFQRCAARVANQYLQ